MKREETSTKCAGIDVGKPWLDVAVHGQDEQIRVDNDAEGWKRLIGWLRPYGVTRVGMEATGGYERGIRSALAAAGLEVVVHQPLEVRLFARWKRVKAKNDRIDARVIAAATAQVDAVRAACDPRLAELAERLTAYEMVTDKAAELQTFLEHIDLADLKRGLQTQIRGLRRLKQDLARKIVSRIQAEPDLKGRFELLLSLTGIGPIVAAALVVRMPELGSMRRGQASALLGVAPYDDDSSRRTGPRRISGGRRRPRRLLYLAAISAKRFDPGLRAFAQRLTANGKKTKVVIVAVMRKLIEAANLVLARGQPWLRKPAT